MEAFLAEPWWWIFGFIFTFFVVIPVCTVLILIKLITWFRDWWNA